MSRVNMLEARMVLHAHHVRFRLRCASIVSSFVTFIVVIIIPATFICEVVRTFMLVRTAIVLEAPYYLIDI